jgi:hypothetical protein
MTPAVRLRREGRSATFRRAPMRANLVSSRFVSMKVWTRAGQGGFAGGRSVKWPNQAGDGE